MNKTVSCIKSYFSVWLFEKKNVAVQHYFRYRPYNIKRVAGRNRYIDQDFCFRFSAIVERIFV